MAQALLNQAEKALLLSRGIDIKALDRMQPQIVFALGLGGGGTATGGGSADPLAIAAGINAAEDIDEIIRLLKRAEIENPTLYTDDNGVIFAPEIISNPDTGAVVRNYKTFPGGVPYNPVGSVRELAGDSTATASGAVQPFSRLSDGSTVFGTYDPATQTLTPYGSSTPLPAAGFEPIDPEALEDHEVVRTAIAVSARAPDYAVGDDLANVMVVGEDALSDIWYNATQNKSIPDPDASDLSTSENPRILIEQKRISIAYAQGSVANFVQPAVGGIVIIAADLITDLPSAQAFTAPGQEVFVVSASGEKAAGRFVIEVGGVASAGTVSAIQLRREPGFLTGAQDLVADGAAIADARVIAISTLSPPATAEWAEVVVHASHQLIQDSQLVEFASTTNERKQFLKAKMRLMGRVAAGLIGSSDLWSDEGVKQLFGDRDSIRLLGAEMAEWRMLGLGLVADSFATITYGRGGDQ